MLKRVLLVILAVLVLGGIVGITGCKIKPVLFESDNLVKIVSYQTVFGAYNVFFFENEPTRYGLIKMIIKFDSSLSKPIVRAKVIPKRTNEENLHDVEVVFRDRKQMREFWTDNSSTE